MALAAQGFGWPRPDRPVTMRDVQAIDQPAGSVPDRLDQRRHPGPFHAAVLPARAVRPRPARPRRAPAAAPAVRVLGARREPDRRHPAAAAPVPDAGRLPRRLGRASSGWPGRTRSWSSSSATRSRPAARSAPAQLEVEEVRDRSNWGWNWSGGQDRAGVAVLLRRGRLGLPQLPVRAGLRPARAGAAAGRARRSRRPTPEESVIGLVRRAAQALGVASEFCLRDYFRTRPAMTRDGDRHAGRGRRADAGQPSTGWDEQAALPVARGRGCRAGSTPGRCSARSTR